MTTSKVAVVIFILHSRELAAQLERLCNALTSMPARFGASR